VHEKNKDKTRSGEGKSTLKRVKNHGEKTESKNNKKGGREEKKGKGLEYQLGRRTALGKR